MELTLAARSQPLIASSLPSTNNPAQLQRPVRFIGANHPQPGWTLKWYGIQSDVGRDDPATMIDPPMLKAAQEKAADVIANEGAATPNHHGVGFGIVHQGKLGNWVFVDWWADDLLLFNRLFRSGAERPLDLVNQESAILACVWELQVFAFERDAWVNAVREEREPERQIQRYLDARLSGNF